MKPTIKIDQTRFNKALRGLADVAGVSTAKFVKNEGRLLALELARSFTPKQRKSEKGIAIDRKMAFKVAGDGAATIPWDRLQQVINRRRPQGRRPKVRGSVAIPNMRLAFQRIGTLAAGFLGRGNKLGVSGVRSSVTRNLANAHGDVTMRFGLISKSVRLRNWTPWLRNMRGVPFLVQRTIRKRTSSMRTNARLITQGVKTYWGKS